MMRFRGSLALALALLAGLTACSGGRQDGVALVGASGGRVAVANGPLAGTELEVASGVLPQNTRLSIEPAVAIYVDGFVAVGPAARFQPDDIELAASVTVVLDRAHPAMVANDPARDLVVLALDDDDNLRVVPVDEFDPVSGRAKISVTRLGVLWAAVRPSDQPFPLADYLPGELDWYAFDNQRDLVVRPAATDPNLPAAPWLGWETMATPLLYGPAVLFPSDGFYVLPVGDGSIEFGGWYQRRTLGLQVIAAETLVLPSAVYEGQVFEMPVAFDLFLPFGAATPALSQAGTLRVTVGERHATTVPVGTFGDVVELLVEVDTPGSQLQWLRVELANRVGPVVMAQTNYAAGALTWAQVGDRIYQ